MVAIQVIIAKHNINSLLNIIILISYVRQAVTHSESHGDLNRCTPYRRKPDTHDMYASYASSHAPLVRLLWAVPVCGNLSR
jgi:hypothetical protein